MNVLKEELITVFCKIRYLFENFINFKKWTQTLDSQRCDSGFIFAVGHRIITATLWGEQCKAQSTLFCNIPVFLISQFHFTTYCSVSAFITAMGIRAQRAVPFPFLARSSSQWLLAKRMNAVPMQKGMIRKFVAICSAHCSSEIPAANHIPSFNFLLWY